MSEDTTAGGVLAFAPLHNSHGKKDADEFQRQARAFVGMHGGKVFLFDNHLPMRQRADQVLAAIDAYRGHTRLVCVAHFGHGWERGVQMGFDIRGKANGRTPDELAAVLEHRAGPGVLLVMYSCSAADAPGPGPSTDGGFCDELRDACCRHGLRWCRVLGHTTAAHTTHNPYLMYFDGQGSPVGGHGGIWVVVPPGFEDHDHKLWREWSKRMRDEKADFDLWIPFLEPAMVAAYLAA